jgi:hypothetical protein
LFDQLGTVWKKVVGMATSPSTRRSRALQLLIVAVLAAALLPIAPARASHVTARNTDDACKDAPEDGFTDTGAEGSANEEAVDCISWYGVTSGTSAKTYSPSATISRAQMATMIANVMRSSEKNFAEPGANEDFFDDDDTSPHERNINFVAKHNVVKGTGAGRYSPGSSVFRDQMATFIANQLKAIGAAVPTATQNYFSDDNGNTHEANINSLAGLGIVTGRAEGLYYPRTSVTRGQMAFFISRDLDYLVEEELMTLPEGDAAEAAAGEHTSVDVVSVDRDEDSFVGGTDTQGHANELFNYKAGDTFELAGTLSNDALTLAEFEGLLTGPLGDIAGDVLDITYAPNGKSTFVVDTDNIPLTKPAVSVVNLDGGTTINDVVITWEGSQPDATYDVYRDAEQVPPGGNDMVDPGDEQVGEGLTATSITVNNQPDGTYNYIVVATGETSGSSSTKVSDEVTVPGTAATAGSPKSENAVLTQDANPAGAETASGDSWRFAFDKALAPVVTGDSLLVNDGAANFTVRHGVGADTSFNASFSLNGGTVTIAGKQYAPGQVLTVQLGRPLGTPPDVAEYPLTVLTSPGLATAAGAVVNWVGSFDRIIQHDTSAPTSSEACQATDTDEVVSKDDVIRITFNEPMNATQPKPLAEQITIRDADGDQIVLTHGGNATFTYSTVGQNGVIDVTVKSGPPAGTVVNYEHNAAITSSVYVIDAAGHAWNIGSSSADGKDLTDDCGA